MKNVTMTAAAVAVLMVAGFVPSAHAGEGGGSSYNGGVENYLTGAAPPPGFHVVQYANVYRADTLKDGQGNTVALPKFEVAANALATRFVWSSTTVLAGGNVVWHAIVPLVDLKVSLPTASQSKTGLGDITFGPALAFHHSPSLHSVVALDFVAPVGGYDKTDIANIGRNYWSIQPVYTASHIDPAGFNGDFKLTGNFNQRNSDTDYKSGTEVYVDYSAGWGLNNGWVLGVGGYVMRQLSEDKRGGQSLPNSKAEALAIGPSIKYDNGKGWFITAKWQQEMSVTNRAEGHALWIKTVIPF